MGGVRVETKRTIGCGSGSIFAAGVCATCHRIFAETSKNSRLCQMRALAFNEPEADKTRATAEACLGGGDALCGGGANGSERSGRRTSIRPAYPVEFTEIQCANLRYTTPCARPHKPATFRSRRTVCRDRRYSRAGHPSQKLGGYSALRFAAHNVVARCQCESSRRQRLKVCGPPEPRFASFARMLDHRAQV